VFDLTAKYAFAIVGAVLSFFFVENNSDYKCAHRHHENRVQRNSLKNNKINIEDIHILECALVICEKTEKVEIKPAFKNEFSSISDHPEWSKVCRRQLQFSPAVQLDHHH
jgi:hypothetical protein